MKRIKYKKQFRLYDVYRYAATGEESYIEGIESYETNADASTLCIRFSNGAQWNRWPRSERELKQIIKQVNKRLGNCDKPGPRRYK